jgi:hypothetical protein
LDNYVQSVNAAYSRYNAFLTAVNNLENGDKIKTVINKINLNYTASYSQLSQEEQNLLDETTVVVDKSNVKVGKFFSDFIEYMNNTLADVYTKFTSNYSTNMYDTLCGMADYILGKKASLGYVGIGEVFYKLAIMGSSTNLDVHSSYKQFIAGVLYDFFTTCYVCNMALNMQINYMTDNDGNSFTISDCKDKVQNIESLLANVLMYSDYEYNKCIETYDIDGFVADVGYNTDDYVVYYGNAVNYVSSGDMQTRYVLFSEYNHDVLYVNEQYVTLAPGESFQIKAFSSHKQVQDEITWQSSDESVAIVSNTGKITAISAGDCTIGAVVDGVYYQMVSVSAYSAYVTQTDDEKDVYTLTKNGKTIEYEVNGTGRIYNFDAEIYGFESGFNADESHAFNLSVKLNAQDDFDEYTFTTFNDNIKFSGIYALTNCNTSGAIIAKRVITDEDSQTTLVIVIPVISSDELTIDTAETATVTKTQQSTSDTYYIYTKQDLLDWREQYGSRTSGAGQNVVLMNDIDFEWDEWATMAAFRYTESQSGSEVDFTAYKFNGNGHTIKNITFIKTKVDDAYYYGLFATASGTIEKLNIENVKFKNDKSLNKTYPVLYAIFTTNAESYASDIYGHIFDFDGVGLTIKDCTISGTVEINAESDVVYTPFIASNNVVNDVDGGNYLLSGKYTTAERLVYKANTVIDCNGKNIDVDFMLTHGSLKSQKNVIYAGSMQVQNIENAANVSVELTNCLYAADSTVRVINNKKVTSNVPLNGVILTGVQSSGKNFWLNLGFSEDLYTYEYSSANYPGTIPALKNTSTLYADTSLFTTIYSLGSDIDWYHLKIYQGTTNVTSKGSFNKIDKNTAGVKQLVFTYNGSTLTLNVLYYDYVYPNSCKVTYMPDEYTAEGSGVTCVAYVGSLLQLEGGIFTRENYNLIGWKTQDSDEVYSLNSIYSVSGEVTFYPVWGGAEYTISFDDENSQLAQNFGGYVYVSTADADDASTPIYNGGTITYGDTIYISYVKPYGYDVTFSVMGAEKVSTYCYRVCGNVTVTYLLEPEEYEISFYNTLDNEDVVVTVSVKYGEMPVYPYNDGVPEKSGTEQIGYTFSGWDKDLAAVSGVASYTATFTTYTKQYTYTFYTEDMQTVLKAVTADYGTVIVAPDAPSKSGNATYNYTFSGWRYYQQQIVVSPNGSFSLELVPINFNEGDTLTGDISYIPNYTPAYVEYTLAIPQNVTVIKGESVLTEDDTVHYGDILTITYAVTTGYSLDKFDVTGATLTGGSYSVTGNVVVTYSEKINSYTVIFYNDEELLGTITVTYGGTAEYTGDTPTKASDVTYTYTFSGWDKQLTNITQDTQFYAQFDSKFVEYTLAIPQNVTVIKGESVLTEDDTVHYGDTLTITYAVTTGYSLDKFDVTGATLTGGSYSVTGNVVVAYSEKINSYTVKFYNGEELLGTITVTYGGTAEYTGTTPTKATTVEYTYIFSGWDKQLTNITQDTQFYAQFDSKFVEYTLAIPQNVTVIKGESVLTEDDTVHYGDILTITYAVTTGYSLDKFEVTGATIVEGGYSVTGNVVVAYSEKMNSYTVKFYNGEELLETITVTYGGTAEYTGDAPTKASDVTYTYTFSGWDKQLTNITQDTQLYALFDSAFVEYTLAIPQNVTIMKGESVLTEDDTVHYGDILTITYAVTSGYSLDKFDVVGAILTDGNYSVTGNVIVTYSEKINSYTVIFYNGEELLETVTVTYGGTAEYTGDTPTKASDNIYSYTFSGWDKQITNITQDTQLYALFDSSFVEYTLVIPQNVTVMKGDKVLTEDDTVHYGDILTITYAVTSGYSLDKFEVTGATLTDGSYSVTGNVVVTYSEKINSYTVKFYNGEELLETITVTYGGTAEYTGATPTKATTVEYTYTFSGWDKQLTNIIQDTQFYAQFSGVLNKYTYTFYDEDGQTVLKALTAEYGATIVAPEAPIKASDNTYSYSFKEWAGFEVGAVLTGDVAFTASYTPTYIEYTVTFSDYNGTVISQASYHYGDEVVAPVDPARQKDDVYEYAFSGWDIEVTTCLGNTVYTATYSMQLRCVTEGHKSSDWIIDKRATTSSEGKRHKQCTVCGEILEEEVIGKLVGTSNKLFSGCSSNVANTDMAIVAVTLAAICAASIAITKRKHK